MRKYGEDQTCMSPIEAELNLEIHLVDHAAKDHFAEISRLVD